MTIDVYNRQTMSSDILSFIQEAGGAELRYWEDNFPEERKTYELCKYIISKYAFSQLTTIPEKHKTYELCKIAVEHYRPNLEFVPEEHKTYELCKLAVGNNGEALRFVPQKHRTDEITSLSLDWIDKNWREYIEACY